MVKQYGELYRQCRTALLVQEDAQYASETARSLVCFYSGKSGAELLADQGLYASESIVEQVEAGLTRLLQGEPLAYILGEWDFYGMTLKVCPGVLIPRDDTCAVTELAISRALFLDPSPRILDLCTGSGCIGLALAHKISDARVTLGDFSPEALSIAKQNVSGQKLNKRVSCVSVNALEKAPDFLGKFDMIVSNPPYISGTEMQELPKSVADYEPHLALFGGEDGLDFYRSIAGNYKSALKPGGSLCLEFGEGQGDAVCRILEEHGFEILERKFDWNGRERAVLARILTNE